MTVRSHGSILRGGLFASTKVEMFKLYSRASPVRCTVNMGHVLFLVEKPNSDV